MWYLALVSFVWAFSFGLIGSRLTGLDSNFVAAMRLSLASACFLPFLRLRGIAAGEAFGLVGVGAVQFGLMYLAYIRAFAFLPSHVVALFSVLTPLYVALASDAFARRFRWRLLACAGLSVLGAAWLRRTMPEGEFWVGFCLMQLANVAFAVGQVTYRRWRRSRPEVQDGRVFGLLHLGGAAFAWLAFVAAGDLEPIRPSGDQWLALGYLGVVASGLGFFWWNKGATKTSSGALAAFNNAVVPLAMIVSLFVFGEASEVDFATAISLLVGGGAILAAIVWGAKLRVKNEK